MNLTILAISFLCLCFLTNAFKLNQNLLQTNEILSFQERVQAMRAERQKFEECRDTCEKEKLAEINNKYDLSTMVGNMSYRMRMGQIISECLRECRNI